MGYAALQAFALRLTTPAIAVKTSGYTELSRWTLLADTLNRKEVKEAGAAAIEEAANLFEALADSPEVGPSKHWDPDWVSDNLAITLTKGLFQRIATDFRAMALLLPAYPRQAAALARGVYEAACWVELLMSHPGAAELYNFYAERDELVGDRPLLDERRALYQALVSQIDNSNLADLRIHRNLADAQAGLDDVDRACAELRDEFLTVVPQLTKRLTKAARSGPRLTPSEARGALGAPAPEAYEAFFKDFLFRATCRLVHASDGIDYYDPATATWPRDPRRLSSRPDDTHALIAAAIVSACLVADNVGEYLSKFSPDEEPLVDEIRVLNLLRGILDFLAKGLPDVPPK